MLNPDISRYIKELLYDHDCVIVPGFGGLVAQPQPAFVNPLARQIHPPSKKIAFNQLLSHNDGLLTSMFSRKASCSYAEALLEVNTYAEEVKKLLQDNHHFVIAGLGSFRIDADNKLIFSPEKSDTFLYESFGLKPVAAIPLAAAEKEHKPRIIEREEKHLPLEVAEAQAQHPGKTGEAIIAKKRKRVGAPFVIVSTVVVLFSAFTMFMASYNIHLPFIGSDSSQSASFANTTYVEPKTLIQQPETVSSAIPEVVPPAPIATEPATSGEPEPAAEIVAEAVPEMNESELPVGYYVIAGAFMYEENAGKMLSSLKANGYDEAMYAGKTKESRLLRVAYMHAATRLEAEEQLKAIRSTKNQDAWILRLPVRD